ncbi:uncharacterized protein LOC126902855 [Daktulosphaira vitifoliae]|uniref:uncharacterized protein LOC126902855 n=1 Tax=Daktulosphaira vitifoliae TaxID=58002 RepID=UPI0021AAF85C|nr:uncharacterized protein LOC126902855 [Daktulosphaira vitifoliae]
MPYNENTIIDDPDIVAINLFNPREHKKPWTWTRKNEIDVPVPIKGTIGLKLGEIIQPCLKNNTNIIQCYTHYLNVIESVGLTLIDRFCLFIIEVFNRIGALNDNTDFIKDYSLFNIRLNISVLSVILEKFKNLLNNICFAFKRYFISTLPLDCVTNTMKKIMLYFNQEQSMGDTIKKQFLNCRKIMKSKINYAVLDNDQYWKWDITSDCKPDDNLLMITQYGNNKLGIKLFPLNNK